MQPSKKILDSELFRAFNMLQLKIQIKLRGDRFHNFLKFSG